MALRGARTQRAPVDASKEADKAVLGGWKMGFLAPKRGVEEESCLPRGSAERLGAPRTRTKRCSVRALHNPTRPSGSAKSAHLPIDPPSSYITSAPRARDRRRRGSIGRGKGWGGRRRGRGALLSRMSVPRENPFPGCFNPISPLQGTLKEWAAIRGSQTRHIQARAPW